MKGSNDLASSLVSNENLCEILPSSHWAQITWAKMAKNLPHDVTHKKNKTKHFFHWRFEDLQCLLRVWTAF